MYSEEDVKFIKEVMERNNFIVPVTVVEQGENYTALSVAYPDGIIDGYKLEQTGIIHVNEEVLYIHPALSRLYVILDIFKQMRTKKLRLTIIECRDVNNEIKDRLDDIIPEVPQEKNGLENKASEAITAITNNKKLINAFDKQMKEDKIYAGFNILKGLMV